MCNEVEEVGVTWWGWGCVRPYTTLTPARKTCDFLIPANNTNTIKGEKTAILYQMDVS